jgi:hypothetical protein
MFCAGGGTAIDSAIGVSSTAAASVVIPVAAESIVSGRAVVNGVRNAGDRAAVVSASGGGDGADQRAAVAPTMDISADGTVGPGSADHAPGMVAGVISSAAADVVLSTGVSAATDGNLVLL